MRRRQPGRPQGCGAGRAPWWLAANGLTHRARVRLEPPTRRRAQTHQERECACWQDELEVDGSMDGQVTPWSRSVASVPAPRTQPHRPPTAQRRRRTACLPRYQSLKRVDWPCNFCSIQAYKT